MRGGGSCRPRAAARARTRATLSGPPETATTRPPARSPRDARQRCTMPTSRAATSTGTSLDLLQSLPRRGPAREGEPPGLSRRGCTPPPAPPPLSLTQVGAARHPMERARAASPARLPDRLDPARLGRFLARARTRYVLSWLLALACAGIALGYAWVWARRPARG